MFTEQMYFDVMTAALTYIYWYKERELKVLRGLTDLIRLQPRMHIGIYLILTRWHIKNKKSRNTVKCVSYSDVTFLKTVTVQINENESCVS